MGMPNLNVMTFDQLAAHFMAEPPTEVEDILDYLQDVALAMATISRDKALQFIRTSIRNPAIDGTRKAALLYSMDETNATDAEVRIVARACLHTDDPMLLAAAIEELENQCDEHAVPTVQRFFHHTDLKVRKAALEYYSSERDAEAIPLLMAAAQEEDAEVRKMALAVMGDYFCDAQFEIMAIACEYVHADPSPLVRKAAADVFYDHDYYDALPLLQQCLREEQVEDVRDELTYVIDHLRNL